MAAPDMDVIKEIPGYKVIMKAILKMQIQQLVEQLASHTDEESVILTASVSDGTLSHLGSDSGKNFLEDHEDIKSQFLGFCLKRHHKKKQQEKEEREALTSPAKMGGPPTMRFQGNPRFSNPRMPMRSPKYPGPPGPGPVHPIHLQRASPSHMRSPGPRHEPYPMTRPQRRPSFNLDQPAPSPIAMKLPLGNKIDNSFIKIEPDDDNTNGSSDNPNTPKTETNAPTSSQPSSPSLKPNEGSQKDDETSSSTSTIPLEASDLKYSDTAPAEGLSLDSDLSNLISGELNPPGTPDSQNRPSGGEGGKSDIDPNVNVKVEAITESEMELEIVGVELGPGGAMDPMQSQESWPQQGGAMGSMADMPGVAGQPGYTAAAPVLNRGNYPGLIDLPENVVDHLGSAPRRNPQSKYICPVCGLDTKFASHYKTHVMIHSGERPFVCKVCGKGFTRNWSLKTHMNLYCGKKLSEDL